jgi:hypothetical protein
MLPFPTPYTQIQLVPNAGMQKALDAAFAGSAALKAVPMTVVALDKAPGGAGGAINLPTASVRGDEIHFTASLAKVAAMLASFELRAAVRRSIAPAVQVHTDRGSPVSAKGIMDEIRIAFYPLIMAAALKLPPLKTCPSELLLPTYAQVIEITESDSEAGWGCEFTPAHVEAMKGMIVRSDNHLASVVVHGLGYGYLDGALAAGGFFEPGVPRGLWLGGDYAKAWRHFSIVSVNDKAVSQAATTNALARLFALAALGQLVDGESSAAMMDLLSQAVAEGDAYLQRAEGLSYRQTHTKIGQGPLKRRPTVYSEASVLQHTRTKKRFVAAWQNLVWESPFNDGGEESFFGLVARPIDAVIEASV